MNASRPPVVDFFIASHVLTDGPAQALRDYLVAMGKRVAFAACPMEDADMPRATVTCYAEGREIFSATGHGRDWKGPVLWLRDLMFVHRWARRMCGAQTVYFGVNNLNTLPGIWLKKAGHCRSVVYYVIDYSHQRFSSVWLNMLYQGVAKHAARHADRIWNLSDRMREVHIGFGAKPENNQLVPIGIEHRLLTVAGEKEIDRNRMVVVSTLYESKGVQLAIEAMPLLPEARLVIVGQGPYEGALRKLTRDLGVEGRVTFFGGATREELFAQVAKSRLALATYREDESSYTYYADPAKPKEYLACGVPVVITRVPWIAGVIEEAPMGMAVDYQAGSLAAACRRLMENDPFWRQCRENALTYMKGTDWTSIFGKALRDGGFSV